SDHSSYTSPHTSPRYPLSLHDALPISRHSRSAGAGETNLVAMAVGHPLRYCKLRAVLLAQRSIINHGQIGAGTGNIINDAPLGEDRKSTRLNSSHLGISYAVFCLKKKT